MDPVRRAENVIYLVTEVGFEPTPQQLAKNEQFDSDGNTIKNYPDFVLNLKDAK